MNLQEFTTQQLEEASKFFFTLMAKKEITEKKDEDLFELYSKPTVRELVVNLFAKSNDVDVFENKNQDTIYLVAKETNDLLTYKNEELRKKLNCENNDELYTALFIMVIIISEFYDNDTIGDEIDFLPLEAIEKKTNDYIGQIKVMDKKEKEDASKEYDVSLEKIQKIWFEMKEYNGSTNLSRVKSSRTGFVYKICTFLEDESMIFLDGKKTDYPRIRTTDKLTTIIQRAYYDTNRKEKFLSLLDGLEKNKINTLMEGK